eukprot:834171-Pelagomonas_calceolata.AAC.4
MALRLYRPGQPCARESMCEVRGVVWENAKITKADCALVQMRRASAQGQMCKTSAELDEDVPGLVATTAFLAVADCRLSRYHIFYFSANSAELDEDVPGAELDEDVPGLGRHYCIPCGRYFQDAASLVDHEKGKPHKKRCACRFLLKSWHVVVFCVDPGFVSRPFWQSKVDSQTYNKGSALLDFSCSQIV